METRQAQCSALWSVGIGMVALNPLMNDFQDLMLWVLGVLDSYDDDGVGFSKTLGGMLTAVYLPIY